MGNTDRGVVLCGEVISLKRLHDRNQDLNIMHV
jgi:hypothetical protein